MIWSSPAGSRPALTKKVVLWSVLVIQIGFIGCIWLLQMNYNQTQEGRSNSNSLDQLYVNFINPDLSKGKNKEATTGSTCARRENINSYDRDFFQIKLDRFNRTTDYAAYAEMELAQELWCYREGTLNDTKRNDIDYMQLQPQCHCANGWHGRDCGQPEIIWRALMTHSRASKRAGNAPLQLHEAKAKVTVQRLFYILDLGGWEHISMELLELQLRALMEVVDYFLIYYISHNKERFTQLTLQRSLNTVLGGGGGGANVNYLLFQCRSSNCSIATAYTHFRHQLWSMCGIKMQPSDLLLYGDSQTVFAPSSLKFLKYYATDVLPLVFRLKYNVYGYFWQHPQRTLLHGIISSLVHIHNALQSGNIDSQSLHRLASYTLGDLNHFGGWSCHYCLPPEQIVRLLQTSESSDVRLPEETRGAHSIDGVYMQQLIAQGTYVDGTTHLLRMRQQNEKYYAPQAALLRGSQNAQLLVNLYDVDVLEDVQDDED